jgi:hypothetical protein
MKGLHVVILLSFLFSLGCASSHKVLKGEHTINLSGGHFFGPGPVEPDLPLPDGRIVNVEFDRHKFEGQTHFYSDGSEKSLLSDGKTKINQNIDAGLLKMGEGDHSFLLVAVDGGPNSGRETYSLDENYNFIWQVDLALDPGFKEGIIRVDDFILTTGIVKLPTSLQTERGFPGGYDKAGSLKSGQYLVGRVGDFDQDGFLDGVLVAAPNVPIESSMLPGAPVGNKRGFKTDIDLPPHLACELTLRGVMNFKDPIFEAITQNNIPELAKLLEESKTRLNAARTNLERALLVGAWKEWKKEGFALTWRLDAVQTLHFISWAFITGYEYPAGKVPESVADATHRMFDQLESLIIKVEALNQKTGDTLPAKKSADTPKS